MSTTESPKFYAPIMGIAVRMNLFLAVWKDAGMLVLAVNAALVFALDVNQCNFSCMYGTAIPDLPSLSLLAGSLSALTLTSDIQPWFLESAPAHPMPWPPCCPGAPGPVGQENPSLGQENPSLLPGWEVSRALGGGDSPWVLLRHSGGGSSLSQKQRIKLNLVGRGRGGSFAAGFSFGLLAKL